MQIGKHYMHKTNEPHTSLSSLEGRLQMGTSIAKIGRWREGKRWVFLLPLLLCLFPLSASSDTLRVMWYNVENLFDCYDEEGKNDEEFLSDGENKWTPYRYYQKLRAIAQVVAAVGDQQLPDIIGLCEVESDSVLTDLTRRRSPLRTAGYQYIVTHSPDERGVNVALLYLPGRFRPLSQQSIVVHNDRPTRDILYVKGLVSPTDTLDLFLCHLPSRRGGARQSQPFRLQAAQVLRQAIDSVRDVRPQARILVMGDFNDALVHTRVGDVLGVVASPSASSDLAHGLVSLTANKLPGTYAYQGKWEVIDHFLVSPSLLQSSGHQFYTSPELTRVAALPFLLTRDEKYGIDIPLRTYIGPRYLGGFSDHLPLVVDFVRVIANPPR